MNPVIAAIPPIVPTALALALLAGIVVAMWRRHRAQGDARRSERMRKMVG